MSFSRDLSLINRLEEIESGNSAIHAFLLRYSFDESLDLTDEDKRIILNNDKSMEIIARKSWHGLYERVYVEYKIPSGGKISSEWLVGSRVIPYRCGLYVPDNGRVMTIDANCLFQSDVLLPRKMYRAYNNYNAYTPLPLYSIRESINKFPDFKSEALLQINSLFGTSRIDDYILLDHNMTATDTIIVAKCVYVDSTFCSSVQIFATDSVIIAPGAEMKYPSGVVLKSSDGSIYLGRNAIIEGYVLVTDVQNHEDELCYTQESGAVLRGLLFVDSKAQVEGIISGSAFLRNPIVKSKKGESQMRLSNMKQISNNIYAYPIVFDDRCQRRVIKRIY